MKSPPPNISIPQNLTNEIRFLVPGTQTRLIFSDPGPLLSQTEHQLCVIEALGSIFATVVAKRADGFLPRYSVAYRYGNVVIELHDYSPPDFRLTYGIVVSTLRGLAFYASLYGYFSTNLDIYDGHWGHVGVGSSGLIIPDT